MATTESAEPAGTVKPRFILSRAPRTILVICTRRIGDVLLTTPLVRSLKARWPDAQIDMLVFRGTEGVLEGNPDVHRVLVVAGRARLRERLADAMRIWRRYDLACAATSSDRARFYSWFAGKKRVGLVDPNRMTRLVRGLMNGIALCHHESDHAVQSALALAYTLGIEPIAEVVAPASAGDADRHARFDARLRGPGGASADQPLAVLHPFPMFAYKRWHIDGWAQLIRWLHGQGYAVALSGGPAAAEREYGERVADAAGLPVLNLIGQLSFGETGDLLRRARLFVGPDTGTTHVAAATGVATIALFGPSNPVRWGPWPRGWPASESPWSLVGSRRRNNVYLLQGEGTCVPCGFEGCDRHAESTSQCLVDLSAGRVIGVAAEMLGLPGPASGAAIPLLPLRQRNRVSSPGKV